MATIKLLTRGELIGADVYQLVYARDLENYWSDESLYLSDDDYGINPLIPYISAVFGIFNYYGPEKITLKQWEALKEAYRNDASRDSSNEQFFIAVDEWLEKGNQGAEHFWMIGL